jgi:ferredoxin
MPSREAKRDQSDYNREELRREADHLEQAVTIPVNVEIKANHRVLNLGEMEKILRRARKIVLQDCNCRTGKGNCDAPVDVCLNIDPPRDYLKKHANKNNAREVTLAEALGALERSHNAGLVHMAYTMKDDDHPTLICSCCPCCCFTLNGLLLHGIATKVPTSKFIIEQDPEKCTTCGKCVDRCVFGARKVVKTRLEYDKSRCFGCGLCASTCPTSAITLRPRAAA